MNGRQATGPSHSAAPSRLLEAWRAGELDLVVSDALLEELERVLARPKLRRWIAEQAVAPYLDLFRRGGVYATHPPSKADA